MNRKFPSTPPKKGLLQLFEIRLNLYFNSEYSEWERIYFRKKMSTSKKWKSSWKGRKKIPFSLQSPFLHVSQPISATYPDRSPCNNRFKCVFAVNVHLKACNFAQNTYQRYIFLFPLVFWSYRAVWQKSTRSLYFSTPLQGRQGFKSKAFARINAEIIQLCKYFYIGDKCDYIKKIRIQSQMLNVSVY